MNASPEKLVISVPPKEEGRADFTLKANGDVSPGLRDQTVDIGFHGWNLHEWCESLIEVQVPS